MTQYFEPPPSTEEAEVLRELGRRNFLPRDYIVLDLETTGFSFDNDYIVDCGWAIVRGGQVVHNDGLLLNWSLVPHVDHAFIKRQLLRLADEYAKKGRQFFYPWERLCSEGVHPQEGLYAMLTLAYETIQRGENIVGHGIWHFDRRMLDSHGVRFYNGWQLPWNERTILDTGLVEKALQSRRSPWPEESLHKWMDLVNRSRTAGLKWNMGDVCIPKYRLYQRFPGDPRRLHTAAYDCCYISHLLETYRQLGEILNGQRQTLDRQF